MLGRIKGNQSKAEKMGKENGACVRERLCQAAYIKGLSPEGYYLHLREKRKIAL